MKKIFLLALSASLFACGGSNEDTKNTDANVPAGAKGSAYVRNDTVSATSPIINAGNQPAVAGPTSEQVPAAAPVDTATATASPAEAAAKPSNTTGAATPAPNAAKPAAPANNDAADAKRGEALIAKSDCLACHRVAEKAVGPSYKDVAAKYPNSPANIARLADKIKKGGSGVWGPIPMTPHPTLSDEDAAAMVKYILSLN